MSLRKKVISREQRKHVRTKDHNIFRRPSKQVFHIIVVKIIMIIIIIILIIIIIIIIIIIVIIIIIFIKLFSKYKIQI